MTYFWPSWITAPDTGALVTLMDVDTYNENRAVFGPSTRTVIDRSHASVGASLRIER